MDAPAERTPVTPPKHAKKDPSLNDQISSAIMNLGDEADSPWSGRSCSITLCEALLTATIRGTIQQPSGTQWSRRQIATYAHTYSFTFSLSLMHILISRIIIIIILHKTSIRSYAQTLRQVPWRTLSNTSQNRCSAYTSRECQH